MPPPPERKEGPLDGHREAVRAPRAQLHHDLLQGFDPPRPRHGGLGEVSQAELAVPRIAPRVHTAVSHAGEGVRSARGGLEDAHATQGVDALKGPRVVEEPVAELPHAPAPAAPQPAARPHREGVVGPGRHLHHAHGGERRHLAGDAELYGGPPPVTELPAAGEAPGHELAATADDAAVAVAARHRRRQHVWPLAIHGLHLRRARGVVLRRVQPHRLRQVVVGVIPLPELAVEAAAERVELRLSAEDEPRGPTTPAAAGPPRGGCGGGAKHGGVVRPHGHGLHLLPRLGKAHHVVEEAGP
mmetsp:Transcript_51289/g.163986  ORF Transcript_51289/g.163986 Transcript_51289/m.163986 type:complete len:300 (-) Transcript_51289:507-1406(-)